ncbi:MAG: ImmA/IrrE family metallo-endopeptidase [Methanobrevibacter sp.]|nr:ImmA/IrrE family metallo-endopeptidase [Candidatus Methanovirga procula]
MGALELDTNPEWLIWARKTAKYRIETVASKIKESPETIKNWEKTGKIEYNNLLKLAEYYQRPTSVFFSKIKPKYDKETPDFRTFGGGVKNNISPSVAFEIRNAKFKRRNLLNIKEECPEFSTNEFKFKNIYYENEDGIPEIIRSKLKISGADIRTKKLKYWIEKLESMGILVFEFYDIDPDEMRGYAIYYDNLPIIGINHRESDNPKKFTLFHELTHLLLKKEGISNLYGYELGKKDEIVCNKIAAEILVPSNLFKTIIIEYEYEKFRKKDVEKLAKEFKVSKDVIIRKALNLNFISKQEYELRKEEFNTYLKYKKSGKRKIKGLSSEKNEKKLSLEEKYQREATKALTMNGHYYTKKLFEAYDNDLISDLDLSDSLNVSLDIVRKLYENISLEESI